MSDRAALETSAVATRSRREVALEQVLDRLAPDARLERADTPDLHVTAVRRLPAVSARYAPFPEMLDARLRDGLRARGIDEPAARALLTAALFALLVHEPDHQYGQGLGREPGQAPAEQRG